MEQSIKIRKVESLTHDVNRFVCERPAGYEFVAGQGTELAIDRDGWREEKRPFSFTSLATEPDLEFIIKSYRDHAGVTRELDGLRAGDRLLIGEAWSSIDYKDAGYFIAGGAGITPFLALLRQLKKENRIEGNRLFFSVKTKQDIIMEEELRSLLGDHVVFVLSDEEDHPDKGYIDEAFLAKRVEDIGKPFYLCGPPPMVKSMQAILGKMGASPEAVVF